MGLRHGERLTVDVWWANLTAADASVASLLDQVELARAAALSQPADRGRSMLAAALLRIAVSREVGVAPEALRVDRTCAECGAQHGAPRILEPASPPRWVSVSHSGLLVVVAVSAHGPVGVDVQRRSELPDPALARAWVEREACFKAFGVGDLAAHAALVRPIRAPLAGYAAALASSTEGIAHVSRRWPA